MDVGGDAGDAGPPMSMISGVVTQLNVINENILPLDGATVSVVGISVTATTNAVGEFSMDVAPGRVFLAVSATDQWGSA